MTPVNYRAIFNCNELKAVLKSINLSIESMKIIKQNLFWAFIYNIGCFLSYYWCYVDSNVRRNCYEFFICDSCFKFS
jgi:hypothetical protein